MEARGATIDTPLDVAVIGVPATTPYLPRERPNPVLSAYLALGFALRLWRDRFPLNDGGTVILLAPFDRRFPHPTQTPYRTFFNALRTLGTRAAHEPASWAEAERAAAAEPRAIKAYREGRSCHPLLPFADWAGCLPVLERLGTVLVAGCRDALAARQLGLVPTHSLGAALAMARARAGASPHRLPRLAALLPDPRSAQLIEAEVYLLNLLVLAQGLRVVGENDVPRLHHVAAVGRVEGHQRVLLDEEDGRSLVVDLTDDLEDLLDEDRREAHRGLVEHQELRLRHQRAADRAHLLLTAGERPAL